jgi:hypothetical protein
MLRRPENPHPIGGFGSQYLDLGAPLVGRPPPSLGAPQPETLDARHPSSQRVVVFDQNLHLIQVILNPVDPVAKDLSHGLTVLLAGEQVAVYSGET